MAIYILIARFYQRFSGKKTGYWLFFVPILLYGVAFVRYASIPAVSGDFWGDLLGASGGLLLIALSTHLSWQMLRPHDRP